MRSPANDHECGNCARAAPHQSYAGPDASGGVPVLDETASVVIDRSDANRIMARVSASEVGCAC
jgi:hypothetical protein